MSPTHAARSAALMPAMALLIVCVPGLAGPAVPWPHPPEVQEGLDPEFGDVGWRMLDAPAGDRTRVTATACAIDRKGRIVVIGTGGTREKSSPSRGILYRLDAGGARDPTFAGGAPVWLHPDGGRIAESTPLSVIVDRRSRILVVGHVRNDGEDHTRMAVWRFDPGGTPDRSFAGDGKFVLRVKRHDAPSRGGAIAIDDDGEIVVAGRMELPTVQAEGSAARGMTIWRLTSKGKLDTTSGEGVLMRDSMAIGSWDWSDGRAIALGPKGQIYVAGQVSKGTDEPVAAVWRVSPYGYKWQLRWLDEPSFAHAIALDEENGVIIAGWMRVVGNRIVSAAWRFTSEVELDREFGRNGIAGISPQGTGQDGSIQGMQLDADGRILVTGRWGEPHDEVSSMFVWRFLPDGKLDPAFVRSGRFTFPAQRFTGDSASGAGLALTEEGDILVAGSLRPKGGASRMAVWKLKNP